jgi:hypothetical protein
LENIVIQALVNIVIQPLVNIAIEALVIIVTQALVNNICDFQALVNVCYGADLKNKLMGVMVYY